VQSSAQPVADVFCRAYREGLEWNAVLEAAGVARSTWWRIEKTGSYTSRTLGKIDWAIDLLIARAVPDPVLAPAHQQESHHG
jgi:hypothetical protein